jgi:hypothetical protein
MPHRKGGREKLAEDREMDARFDQGTSEITEPPGRDACKFAANLVGSARRRRQVKVSSG